MKYGMTSHDLFAGYQCLYDLLRSTLLQSCRTCGQLLKAEVPNGFHTGYGTRSQGVEGNRL